MKFVNILGEVFKNNIGEKRNLSMFMEENNKYIPLVVDEASN